MTSSYSRVSRSLCGFLATAGAAALLASSPAQGQVYFQSLGPAGINGNVTGISGDGGVVVGSAQAEDGAMFAFRWTPGGGLEELPEGRNGIANGVSTDGSTIIGSSTFGRSIWTATGVHPIPGLTPGSQLTAVSGDGSILAGSPPTGDAYRWTEAGGMQSLGGPGYVFDMSDDGSVMVGGSFSMIGRGFRWTPDGGMQSLGALPDSWHTSAPAAVSGDGSTIVGSLLRGLGTVESRPMRWTEAGGFEFLAGLTPETGGYATDISDNGLIVGNSGAPCIWFPDGSVQLLSEYFSGFGVDLGGATLTEVHSISADGMTFGGAAGLDGERINWVVHVPTPGAGVAFILGGLTLARRRRVHAPM